MREILFKAKRIDNGEWVEGYLSHPHSKTEEGIDSYYFYALDEMGWVSQCTVSAKTVCQYTGLTDKNGKKIFEGDVCSFADFHSGSDVETYCEGVWSYEGCQLFISDRLSCETEDLICEGKFDGIIIGNIHDNPELLKGE